VKGSLRTGSEGVEVDRRMRAFAWRGTLRNSCSGSRPPGLRTVSRKPSTRGGVMVYRPDVNDEARMTKRLCHDVRHLIIRPSFGFCHFLSKTKPGKEPGFYSSISAGAGVADFKRVASSPSWSRGLTGIARRISTGFLSCGWTGIAF
jgi:hypothetical protein